MTNKNPNGRYNKQFIEMIIGQYEGGKSVTNLCKDYDLKDKTLYRWIKEFSVKVPKGNASKYEKEISNDELKKINKELADLKLENEVLKKCVTIFSRT